MKWVHVAKCHDCGHFGPDGYLNIDPCPSCGSMARDRVSARKVDGSFVERGSNVEVTPKMRRDHLAFTLRNAELYPAAVVELHIDCWYMVDRRGTTLVAQCKAVNTLTLQASFMGVTGSLFTQPFSDVIGECDAPANNLRRSFWEWWANIKAVL